VSTTLLFTDVEGSTRLLHELGEGYAAVLAEHRRVLREAFGAHGGAEVDTQGDAFFFTFAEPAQSPGPMLYRRYTLHISKIHIDPKGMATPPHQELTDHCRAPAQLASFTKLTSRCPVFGSSRKTESPCCCRILPIAAVSGTSMAGSRA